MSDVADVVVFDMFLGRGWCCWYGYGEYSCLMAEGVIN